MTERVTIRKPDDFINIVDILKDITSECVFVFNKENIKIMTFDSGLSCLSDIVLSKPYKKLALSESKSIGLNLKDFHNKLQLKSQDDVMVITFNEDDIRVKFTKPESSKSSVSFSMKMLNIDEVDVELDLDLSNNIKLNSKYFSKLINDIKRFGEDITLSGTKDTFSLKYEDEVEIKTSNDDDDILEIDINNDFNISFLLKFFTPIKKAEKITEEVILNMENNEMPLIIKYEKKNTKIHFIISPKTNDN